MDGPETADGTLVIMVCRAKHLPNRRKLDKQSPYVLLRIATTAKKTPSHFRAGQTPEWTHEIRFQLSRDRKPVLKLDVLDETKNDPTPIGATEIDCSKVFLNPENLQSEGKYILDGWYNLTCNGRQAGQIYLEMTFYPSAPVLPPKVGYAVKLLPSSPEQSTFRSLAPLELKREMEVVNDAVFRLSDPGPDSVFVSGDAKKSSRFSKLKSKFRTREPISSIWQTDKSVIEDETIQAPLLSPIESIDRQQAGSSARTPSPPPHLSYSPFERLSIAGSPETSPERKLGRTAHRTPDRQTLSLDLRSPELKSPHIRSPHIRSPEGRTTDRVYRSDYQANQSDYITSQIPHHSPTRSKLHRKPPPDMDQLRESETTSIPFSADTFGVDEDPMPTKVFHLGEAVQSLTHSDKPLVDPHEIDPKYYAPSPSEQLAKSWRLESGDAHTKDIHVQLNTESTGYLGEGKWQSKFSPSVFQRINDENSGSENKPAVPPKIPQGLTEREYYVLDRENYLKDINGRRM